MKISSLFSLTYLKGLDHLCKLAEKMGQRLHEILTPFFINISNLYPVQRLTMEQRLNSHLCMAQPQLMWPDESNVWEEIQQH